METEHTEPASNRTIHVDDIAAWMRHSERESLEIWRLRLRAEQAQLANGFDQLTCLGDCLIDQYPYQLDAALKALRDMRGRALLADEVGLGKTIEAGIVMKELVRRGLADKILILTPASLVAQWQEEMEDKFTERFELLARQQQLENHPADAPIRWICSLERGKSTSWSPRLLAQEYDLLIVDEAHKLKNRSTQAYQFVNQIRKRYALLLTATPVHNNLMELHSLITILQPGHLGTAREFKRSYIYSGMRRRVLIWHPRYSWLGAILRDANFAGTANYIDRTWPADINDLTLPTATVQDPKANNAWRWSSSAQDIERGQQILTQIGDLLSQGYRVKKAVVARSDWRPWGLRRPNPIDLHNRGRVFGFRVELELPHTDKTIPNNAPQLRRQLNQVMIRNRRAHVGVQLPLRRAHLLYLDLSPQERALYDGVTAYVRDQVEQADDGVGPLRMALITLQREVCSSPSAVMHTLRHMQRNPRYTTSQPQLSALTDLAARIESSSKAQAVLRILDQVPGKLLLFTDYLESMNSLYETLCEAGILAVRFHGGLPVAQKEQAVRAFRRDARVMISTESGAEGRNLQFCYQMVNYDLPWNPMRIEQRIGRIHRLGQTHEVLILNLAGKETIEAQILDLLARKIRMFELVVGELDLILGAMETKSFETLLRDAWLESHNDEELAARIAELEYLIDASRRTFERIQTTSDALSDLLAAKDEIQGEIRNARRDVFYV